MQTQEFHHALQKLQGVARKASTAMMGAEALPWRCHRSVIADALLVRGWQVLDIFDARKASPRTMTPFARVEGLRITYPQPAASAEGD